MCWIGSDPLVGRVFVECVDSWGVCRYYLGWIAVGDGWVGEMGLLRLMIHDVDGMGCP